jgi:hypothetical protein
MDRLHHSRPCISGVMAFLQAVHISSFLLQSPMRGRCFLRDWFVNLRKVEPPQEDYSYKEGCDKDPTQMTKTAISLSTITLQIDIMFSQPGRLCLAFEFVCEVRCKRNLELLKGFDTASGKKEIALPVFAV